jgi:hypothetical protein
MAAAEKDHAMFHCRRVEYQGHLGVGEVEIADHEITDSTGWRLALLGPPLERYPVRLWRGRKQCVSYRLKTTISPFRGNRR